MRKVKISAILFILSLILTLAISCEKTESEPGDQLQTQTAEFTGGSFKMILCPGGTFLSNDDDSDLDFEDGPELTVEPFWISEVEVTNELLAWIYNCASGLDIVPGAITGGPPIFDTEDINAPNYLCEDYVKWGDQPLIYTGGSQLYGYHDIERIDGFYVRSGLDDHPCTDITWYGAIMACNWFTEQGAGLGTLSKVYSGIDYDEWWDDQTVCDFNKKGFRLPTQAEWECAARWQGTDNSGDCYEYPVGSGQYWTKGGCASGAVATSSNVDATAAVAVYEYDSDGYTNPDDNEVGKGDRQPNKLGLYDMSGNVWEWCFDDAGNYDRFIRGGSAQSKHHDVRIISTWDYASDGTASDLGFRLVMSAD